MWHTPCLIMEASRVLDSANVAESKNVPHVIKEEKQGCRKADSHSGTLYLESSFPHNPHAWPSGI